MFKIIILQRLYNMRMNKSKTEKSLNTGKKNKIRQNYHKKTMIARWAKKHKRSYYGYKDLSKNR
nr:hypothetical protein [Treponema putidum]